MKSTLRLKGQALALVLIVVVLAVIVVVSVSSRVATDIRQQGLERASARAESLAESAVDKVTQLLQQTPTLLDSGATVSFPLSSDSTDPSSLDLCSPSSTDISTNCANESTAEAKVFKKIIKFKVLNSESIEGHLAKTGTGAANVSGDNAKMVLSAFSNSALSSTETSLYVRAFKNENNDVKLVGECIWTLLNSTVSSVQCLPTAGGIVPFSMGGSCPDAATYGDLCMGFAPSGSAISFYRVKALLKPSGTQDPKTSFVEVSLRGNPDTSYDFPVAQMAFIRAGVYTGSQDNDQGIFQEVNRLILLNPAVPEAFDYALYNGSGEPVKKD